MTSSYNYLIRVIDLKMVNGERVEVYKIVDLQGSLAHAVKVKELKFDKGRTNSISKDLGAILAEISRIDAENARK